MIIRKPYHDFLYYNYMTINCKGKLIDLTSPKVMGIINVTPNSFYDGGKYKTTTDVLNNTEVMLTAGATFIDIGGYSSKPGAEIINEKEEISRVLPIVKEIIKEFPQALLSIDTFRSAVAEQCIEAGAAIINDISAGKFDSKILEIVAAAQVPYVMMHMKGTPQTMQGLAQYENILKEILFYFSERIAMARSYGINDIIVDPGFGFAKNIEQNYELMQKLQLLQILDLTLLIGVSRKSMVYKPLNSDATQALNGTTALHTIALSKGANILRVHDVKEAMECITLFNKTKYEAKC